MTAESKQISAAEWATTTYADFDTVTGEPESVTDVGVKLSVSTSPVDLTRHTDHNAFGNVVSDTDAAGVNIAVRTFDVAGRETQSQDASGVVSHTTYDDAGNTTATWRSHESTSARIDWKTTSYDAASSPVTDTVLAADGAVVSTVHHEYDALGREVTSDDSLVPGVATTVYDSRGHAIVGRSEGASMTTDAATSRTQFDAEEDIVRAQDPGMLTAATEIDYRADGQAAAADMPDGTTTASDYNAAGQMIASHASSDVGTATVAYEHARSGEVIEVTAPDEAVTVFAYDLLGRQTGAKAGAQQLSGTVYNTLGQVLSHADYDGIVTTSSYDAVGRVASTSRGGLVTEHSYDGCGRVVRTVNPDGSERLVTYDVFGWESRQLETSSEGEIAHDEITSFAPSGRVAQEQDLATGRIRTMSYSPDGVIREAVRLGSRATTITRSGALQELDFEAEVAGVAVDRSVTATDAAGRVTSWSSTSLSAEDSAEYDEVGRLASLSSVDASYTYSADSGRKTAEDYHFGFAGRSETASYTYALDGRLGSATIGGMPTEYVCDAVSGAVSEYRRGIEPSVTLSYSATTGRITSLGSIAIVHDSLGRRTSEGGTARAHAWTGERLSGLVTSGGPSAMYAYDASGQRTTSVVTSGSVTTTTTWVYEGLSLLGYSATRSDGATWAIDYLADDSGQKHYDLATKARKNGKMVEAARELGKGIHSIQDIHAHGSLPEHISLGARGWNVDGVGREYYATPWETKLGYVKSQEKRWWNAKTETYNYLKAPAKWGWR